MAKNRRKKHKTKKVKRKFNTEQKKEIAEKNMEALKDIRGEQTKSDYYEKYKTYDEYLKSKEWKTVKSIFLKSQPLKCEFCGTANKIQVHHLSYYNLGTYREIKDLSLFCRKHHIQIHEIQKEKGISVRKATLDLMKRKRKNKPKKKFQKQTKSKKEANIKQKKKTKREKESEKLKSRLKHLDNIKASKLQKQEIIDIKQYLRLKGMTVFTNNLSILKKIKEAN